MADRSVRPLRHLVHAVTGANRLPRPRSDRQPGLRGASVAEARRHCTVTMCRHWPKRYKSRSLPRGSGIPRRSNRGRGVDSATRIN